MLLHRSGPATLLLLSLSRYLLLCPTGLGNQAFFLRGMDLERFPE